jgi:uncharacterized protein YcbK (DUF882 family)
LKAWRRWRLKRLLPDGKVSPHFRYAEFATKDGTPIPVRALPGLRELCRDFLEPMRERFGPAHVMSGYRHRAYNAKIGGARNSFHIWDEHPTDCASDVIFATGTPDEWGEEARELRARKRGGRGGVGVYPWHGFIHMDVREYQADWRGRSR